MESPTTYNSRCSFEAALYYAERGWRVLPVHSVRRGRCTCGNLKLVMEVLGHKDVKSALRYQHPDLEIARGVMNGAGRHRR